MWIFTRYGFFSVVCARVGVETDPKTVMVRARVRAHLEALQRRFPSLVGVSIRQDVGTDYRYRMIVPKACWKEVGAHTVEEVAYGNFKSEAARFQGDAGRDYVQALHDVWVRMYTLQEEE